jgi:hypothetical protein
MSERPRDVSWQERLLEVLPSGIDIAQLERFLKLTPTERLEEMRQTLLSIEQAQESCSRISRVDPCTR